MYRTFLFALLLSACTTQAPNLSQQAEQEIRAADLAMSEQASREGFFQTLLTYADKNAVKYDEGTLPIIGKEALQKAWKNQPDTKAISWKPFKVEVATSGDLGYSLGYWKYTGPDTTVHGAYYTIWKKQADGKWKFVLDGGGSTPEPPEPVDGN